jgi:hypothetical protein
MSDKSQEANQAQELIMAASGSSFKTKEAAQSSMKQKGFSFSTHEIVGVDDGGFALKELPPKDAEQYYVVKFAQRSSEQDPEDVQLFVNGEVLIMQREKEIIVPQRFLECADHATHDQFRSVPGRSHKSVAKIKTYPYERIRLSTEKEYLKQHAEGTRTVKMNIKKYGFDATPDDVEE